MIASKLTPILEHLYHPYVADWPLFDQSDKLTKNQPSLALNETPLVLNQANPAQAYCDAMKYWAKPIYSMGEKVAANICTQGGFTGTFGDGTYHITADDDEEYDYSEAHSAPPSDRGNQELLKPLKTRVNKFGAFVSLPFKKLCSAVARLEPKQLQPYAELVVKELEIVEQAQQNGTSTEFKVALDEFCRKVFTEAAMIIAGMLGTLEQTIKSKKVRKSSALSKVGASRTFSYWRNVLTDILALDWLSSDSKRFLAGILGLMRAVTCLSNRVKDDYKAKTDGFSGKDKQNASKKIGNNPGRLGHQIGSKLDAVDGKPDFVKEADRCRDAALRELQSSESKPKAYSRTNSELQQTFNNLRKRDDKDKPIVQLNEAVRTALEQKLEPHCELMHVDMPLVVTRNMDQIIHNIDGPALFNTQKVSELVIQRISLVYDRLTGECKLLDAALPEAFRATDSYQTGIPYEILVPYLFRVYHGDLSKRGARKELQKDHGITIDHSTFDVMLVRTNKIVAKIAALIEKLFILCNTHAHMDETFYPFEICPAVLGNRKDRVTYYVMVVTAARSSDFKGTIYKVSKSRSEEDFNKVFGDVLDAMSALNSDRYAVYGSLMALRNGLVGYCWSHLLREMVSGIDDYLEEMAKIEKGYIDGLKLQGLYDTTNGLKPAQYRELNSKLDKYWKAIPKGCQNLINATYCITQIFFIEEWVNNEWAATFDHSTTFEQTGSISDEERKRVCDKVMGWRQVSLKYFECTEKLIEEAKLDQDSKFEKVEKAIGYFLNGIIGFKNFLKDPELSIDNNPAELKVKKITPLRKLQRINQNPENLEQACNFHTCLQTMLNMGYTENSFSDMLLFLINKLFVHTIEQGAQQWIAEHDLDKSPLSNMIFFLTNDTYLDSFPICQHVFDFLDRERIKLRDNEGLKCDTVNQNAVRQILQEERSAISEAKRQPHSPLCPVAKSKIGNKTKVCSMVKGKTAKSAQQSSKLSA